MVSEARVPEELTADGIVARGLEDVGFAEEVHGREGVAVGGKLGGAGGTGCAAVEGEEDGVAGLERFGDVGAYGDDVGGT